jgi:hypothetical protein
MNTQYDAAAEDAKNGFGMTDFFLIKYSSKRLWRWEK